MKLQKTYDSMSALEVLRKAVRCGDRLYTTDVPGAWIELLEGNLAIRWNNHKDKYVIGGAECAARYNEILMEGVKV